MYAFPVTDLAERLDALLELADIDEVILTRAGADNLVLVREPVWRGVQEALHLLGNDLNAERLLCSLLQLRAELLPLKEQPCPRSGCPRWPARTWPGGVAMTAGLHVNYFICCDD